MLLRFLVCAALLVPAGTTAKPPTASSRPSVRETLDKIKQQCGITTGQFSYDDDRISFIYDGMIEAEKLDCARDLTELVGVSFRTYDTSAPYSGPSRYVVKGHPKRMDAVASAALASRWTITHRADGPDGMTFLEIETGKTLSRREVREFLDRFKGEFSDVPVGLAPRTLAGYDQPAPGTAFRASARQMYEDLSRPSCGAPPGFDREAMLRPDRASVVFLEQELAGKSAALHLQIAREDVAADAENLGCSWDKDPAFAKIHVEDVKNSVRVNSTRLRQLAPAVDPLPQRKSPGNAAEFRRKVRNLIEWTLPLCTYTSKGSNDAVLAAARARISAFKDDRLRGSPYALHFAIAAQDATLDRSNTVAECDNEGSESVAKLSASALQYAKKQLAGLEKVIQP